MTFDAAPLSHVSVTTNSPDRQTPDKALNRSQLNGSGQTTWTRTAAEASDARPAKARMCPTRRIMEGLTSEPTTNPP